MIDVFEHSNQPENGVGRAVFIEVVTAYQKLLPFTTITFYSDFSIIPPPYHFTTSIADCRGQKINDTDSLLEAAERDIRLKTLALPSNSTFVEQL